MHVIGRSNVRLAVKLGRDVTLPQQRGAGVHVHPVFLRIGGVELNELPIHVALRIERQAGAVDTAVLFFLDHRRAAERALDHSAGVTILQHPDLPDRAVAGLELEKVFDCVCHYVV